MVLVASITYRLWRSGWQQRLKASSGVGHKLQLWSLVISYNTVSRGAQRFVAPRRQIARGSVSAAIGIQIVTNSYTRANDRHLFLLFFQSLLLHRLL